MRKRSTKFAFDTPGDVIKQIRKLNRQEEPVDVRNLINDALGKWPKSPRLNILKGENLLESGQTEEGIAILKKVASEHPTLPDAQIHLIQYFFKAGDLKAAAEVGENAIAHIPNNLRLLMKLFRIYIILDNPSQVKRIQKILDPLLRNTPDGKMQLDKLHTRYPSFKFQSAAKLILNHLNLDFLDKFRSESDYTYFRNENSDSALLVFSKFHFEVGCIPVILLHELIEPYNLNIIYLNDSSNSLCLNGITSLGDNLDKTIHNLANTLNSWNIKNIHCMGSSGLGYPAALYGIKLKANSIAMFSGAASMEKAFLEKDGRGKNYIRSVLNKASENCHDLPDLINKCESPPYINFYFGGDNDWDIIHAEHLFSTDLK